MSKYARLQTCACGNGCADRSAITYMDCFIARCIPDAEAVQIVDIIERFHASMSASSAMVMIPPQNEVKP